MHRGLARYLELLRSVFASESLPPPPRELRRAARRGFAHLLLSIEPLPRELELRRPRRPGLAAALFAREGLPVTPLPAPPRRAHWLRWLLVPERPHDPHGPEAR